MHHQTYRLLPVRATLFSYVSKVTRALHIHVPQIAHLLPKVLYIKRLRESHLCPIGLMQTDIYMSIVIHSFIHSDHFYSALSSPLPLRGAPDYSTDTVSEFRVEVHRQLQVQDLPKVLT